MCLIVLQNTQAKRCSCVLCFFFCVCLFVCRRLHYTLLLTNALNTYTAVLKGHLLRLAGSLKGRVLPGALGRACILSSQATCSVGYPNCYHGLRQGLVPVPVSLPFAAKPRHAAENRRLCVLSSPSSGRPMSSSMLIACSYR